MLEFIIGFSSGLMGSVLIRKNNQVGGIQAEEVWSPSQPILIQN